MGTHWWLLLKCPNRIICTIVLKVFTCRWLLLKCPNRIISTNLQKWVLVGDTYKNAQIWSLLAWSYLNLVFTFMRLLLNVVTNLLFESKYEFCCNWCTANTEMHIQLMIRMTLLKFMLVNEATYWNFSFTLMWLTLKGRNILLLE
jgi:hypothetical protein